MKNQPRIPVTRGFLLLALLLLQGCNVSTSKVTFGSGDHLKNSRGNGSGEVHGVKIEVIDAGGNNLNANQVTEEGSPVDGGAPVKGDTTTKIELGKIQLTVVKSPGEEITVIIDGKGYGQVEPGDSVVVDGERNVVVNGETPYAAGELIGLGGTIELQCLWLSPGKRRRTNACNGAGSRAGLEINPYPAAP